MPKIAIIGFKQIMRYEFLNCRVNFCVRKNTALPFVRCFNFSGCKACVLRHIQIVILALLRQQLILAALSSCSSVAVSFGYFRSFLIVSVNKTVSCKTISPNCTLIQNIKKILPAVSIKVRIIPLTNCATYIST